MGHNTYHHFTGNGISDSQLDILISSVDHPDRLEDIICKNYNPLITSSHDLIVSSFELTPKPHQPQDTPMAPRVIRLRYRVVWDSDGIPLYSSILGQTLPPLLASCGDSSSPQKISALLNQTNLAILNAARQSF